MTTVSGETFLNYRQYRWLWVHLVLVVIMIALYVLNNPAQGRSGNSYLGYTYGILAAAGIVYLMWFGVRKRSYYSTNSTVIGWLSVHVWLGVALLILVPLHAAFSFGMNVHTLAFVLMVLTIISGMIGAVFYTHLAPLIQAHRGGGTTGKLSDEITAIDRQITDHRSNGMPVMAQIRERLDVEIPGTMWQAFFGPRGGSIDRSALVGLVSGLGEGESTAVLEVISLLVKKSELCERLGRELRIMALLRGWLSCHLVLSFGLLASLIAHILAVLYFR